ncbi:hypothetical protein KIL84_004472 [Mauremys mutica]|uniref:Uncharacterized protein n=1 Tax=Mauremys mutica TaxID=74926 RepID=A0A9D3XPR2_9SAUR|nr:hypothetical protein KIL84_004472 [Mauremys mutica]
MGSRKPTALVKEKISSEILLPAPDSMCLCTAMHEPETALQMAGEKCPWYSHCKHLYALVPFPGLVQGISQEHGVLLIAPGSLGCSSPEAAQGGTPTALIYTKDHFVPCSRSEWGGCKSG